MRRIASILISMCCAGCALAQPAPYAAPVELPRIALQPTFYDAQNFSTAITGAAGIQSESDIAAVIVPHHLLAASYIANVLQRTAGRTIERVIVIGPNHENLGPTVFATAAATWDIPFGPVSTNPELVESFLQTFTLQSNPSVFTNEHSIGAEMPFIKHYFPEATVLPIVISSTATRGDVDRLVDWFDRELDDKTLLLVSVDFSHYLPQAQAEQKDAETRALMEQGNVDGILRLDNQDYVDSPGALATVIALSVRRGWEFEIVEQGNSNQFSVQPSIETTSYFGIVFRNQ
jgi:AmmeMemoRadiSam system protein B